MSAVIFHVWTFKIFVLFVNLVYLALRATQCGHAQRYLCNNNNNNNGRHSHKVLYITYIWISNGKQEVSFEPWHIMYAVKLVWLIVFLLVFLCNIRWQFQTFTLRIWKWREKNHLYNRLFMSLSLNFEKKCCATRGLFILMNEIFSSNINK